MGIQIDPTLHFTLKYTEIAIMGITSEVPKTVQWNGSEVPVYSMQTIDFSRLLSQEPEELEKLLKCCQDEGFFYIDLQGIDGRRFLDDQQETLKLMNKFFDSPLEVKNEFGLVAPHLGYEPVGPNRCPREHQRWIRNGQGIPRRNPERVPTHSPQHQEHRRHEGPRERNCRLQHHHQGHSIWSLHTNGSHRQGPIRELPSQPPCFVEHIGHDALRPIRPSEGQEHWSPEAHRYQLLDFVVQ